MEKSNIAGERLNKGDMVYTKEDGKIYKVKKKLKKKRSWSIKPWITKVIKGIKITWKF